MFINYNMIFLLTTCYQNISYQILECIVTIKGYEQ
jgi:hypothetical protein